VDPDAVVKQLEPLAILLERRANNKGMDRRYIVRYI
jgi:hypothetical protein